MAEHISKKARKRPISRHPLFPATVALWFAALFGLGSLIIRPVLLESLVLALHLDALIPAAAPPLGVTARMLLALGMTALGGVVGLVVARRIPRSGRGAKPKQDADPGQDSPLWSELKTRHRAISTGQDEPPSEPEAAAVETDGGMPAVVADAADPVVTHEPPAERRTPALLKAPTVSAADRIAFAELCELSHVELLERLALSLERRRGRGGSAEASFPLEAVAAALMPEAEPKPQSQPRPEPQPELAPQPAQSLEPVRTELPRFVSGPTAHAPVAIAADWSEVAPNRFLPAPHEADEWEDAGYDCIGDETRGDAQGGYSSLMNLSRPVPFDGSAAIAPRPFAEIQPKGPEETERALRAALATLQRMSGAA